MSLFKIRMLFLIKLQTLDSGYDVCVCVCVCMCNGNSLKKLLRGMNE